MKEFNKVLVVFAIAFVFVFAISLTLASGHGKGKGLNSLNSQHNLEISHSNSTNSTDDDDHNNSTHFDNGMDAVGPYHEDNDTDKGNRSNNSSNHGNHNSTNQNRINYGLCVKNYTEQKKDCFKKAKETFKVCKSNLWDIINADNSTLTNRTIIKQKFFDCLSNYKDSLKQCKADFKQWKETCRQFKCKENQSFVNGTCILV